MAAARAQQLLGKAKAILQPTTELMTKTAISRYEALMAENAQYVIKDQVAADKLLKQIPSGIVHMKEEVGVLKNKWAQFRELPTAEVAIYAGFAAELYAWFCIGEIVGRGGSLTGYSV